MNNRTLYLIAFALLSASSTGCQKKVIYATPQITGQVIDKQTNQPIEGVKTVLSSNAIDFTDAQGRFTVPPVTYEYTVKAPSHRRVMSNGVASFMIYKPGYGFKSYRSGGLAFIPKPYTEKSYVDMGKIYLMPVPIGMESEYEVHYSTLNFCKPTESQREVDCIPVPKGKTYEQVSPNQPIE